MICILYKWSIDWSKADTQPPSLLTMIIGMFLSPGTVEADTRLYPGQSVVQVVLLGLAGICVPWLLITKPYLMYKEMKKIHEQGYIELQHGEDVGRGNRDLEGEEEGNGGAFSEDREEEGGVSHASFTSVTKSVSAHVWVLLPSIRRGMILARLWCTRSYIL